MNILITRNKKSLHYLKDPNKGHAWDNNDGNNSLDTFQLFDKDKLLFECKVQTVTNLTGLHAGIKDSDTIAPRPFEIVAFVPPRLYKCQPHGIINTVTMGGDVIHEDSTTDTNKLRWLIHDWRNFEGKETRVAWSAGCFVLPVEGLATLNTILVRNGIKRGDIIQGELVEV